MTFYLVQKDSASLIIKAAIIVVFSRKAVNDDVLYIDLASGWMIERATYTTK